MQSPRRDTSAFPWWRLIRSVANSPESLLSLRSRACTLCTLGRCSRALHDDIDKIGWSCLAEYASHQYSESKNVVNAIIQTDPATTLDQDLIRMLQDIGITPQNHNFRIDFISCKNKIACRPLLGMIKHCLYKEKSTLISFTHAHRIFGVFHRDPVFLNIVQPNIVIRHRGAGNNPVRRIPMCSILDASLMKHGSSLSLQQYSLRRKHVAEDRALKGSRRQILRMQIYDAMRPIIKSLVRDFLPIDFIESHAHSDINIDRQFLREKCISTSIETLLEMSPAQNLGIVQHIRRFGCKGTESDICKALEAVRTWKSQIAERSEHCLKDWFRNEYERLFKTDIISEKIAHGTYTVQVSNLLPYLHATDMIGMEFVTYVLTGELTETVSIIHDRLLDRSNFQSWYERASILEACQSSLFSSLDNPLDRPYIEELADTLTQKICQKEINLDTALNIIGFSIPTAFSLVCNHPEFMDYTLLPSTHPFHVPRRVILMMILWRILDVQSRERLAIPLETLQTVLAASPSKRQLLDMALPLPFPIHHQIT